jgi:hypothetical protein
MDYPDQRDILKGDPIVPDKPVLVVGVVGLRIGSGQLAIVPLINRREFLGAEIKIPP